VRGQINKWVTEVLGGNPEGCGEGSCVWGTDCRGKKSQTREKKKNTNSLGTSKGNSQKIQDNQLKQKTDAQRDNQTKM